MILFGTLDDDADRRHGGTAARAVTEFLDERVAVQLLVCECNQDVEGEIGEWKQMGSVRRLAGGHRDSGIDLLKVYL